MRRVYYALTFDQEATNKIITNVNILKDNALQIKPIPENSIHMTMAFLGEVEESMIDELLEIRDEINFEPFSFNLDYLDSFPDRNSRLYYLGTNQSEELYVLQKSLVKKLYQHKIAFHDRQFLPHVTLSRKTVLKKEPKMLLPINCTITSLELLESIPYKETRIGIPVKKIANE